MGARKRLAAAVLGAVATVGTARAGDLTLGGVTYKGSAPLKSVKVGTSDGVEVAAPGDGVTLDFPKPASGASVTGCTLGIAHVDAKTHGFTLTFGRAGFVTILCDESPAAGATFTPSFTGAATYSVQVTQGGKVVQSLSNRKGSFNLVGFDSAADGHEETLQVSVGYGAVRKGAWSITVTHDDHVVVITADGTQDLGGGAGEISLKTTGLDRLTLVDAAASTK